MRVLLLNQVFWPDHVATAQYLTSLATELAKRGHQVTALSAGRAYDDPTVRFRQQESWNHIDIFRISIPGLGKGTVFHRLLDFLAYFLGLAWRLVRLPRQDVVVALTTPPLVAAFGAAFTRLKGGRLVYWVMDLNPDQAIASGLISPSSPSARAMEWLLQFVLRSSDRVVVLDRFVRDRLLPRGVPEEDIEVIPPWSLDEGVSFDDAGRRKFRAGHGLTDKFVVMHSGNHSPCHPLDTVLACANHLSNDPRIAFTFVGGGTEHAKVKAYAEQNGLSNVLCLPYQPVAELSGSLSAADLHLVALGDPYVGIVHPCKVYNVLKLGIPILYLGPSTSHVSDLAADSSPPPWFLSVRHGDANGITRRVLDYLDCPMSLPCSEEQAVASRFSQNRLLTKLITIIERL